MALASIINALPQTVLLKCSTAIRGSAAQYSWDTQISCLTHAFPIFSITDICYVITGGSSNF